MAIDRVNKDIDVVVTTRINISRNIKGHPFCSKMTKDDKDNVIDMVCNTNALKDYTFTKLDEIDASSKQELFRNNLINAKDYSESTKKAVLYSDKNEGVSVVLNGDDHLRINSFSSGGEIVKAYVKADSLASSLEKELDIAFSDKYGFLTSKVANMGTGIKIYSNVFIPGIEKTEEAYSILSTRLQKYDWTIVPSQSVSGEKLPGIYTLTNVVTLGISEKELLSRAACVIDDVVKLEKKCRSNICNRKKVIVDDQYYRAYATLRYARRLDALEALNLINWLVLGLEDVDDTENLGISWDKLNKLTKFVFKRLKVSPKAGENNIIIGESNAEFVRSVLKGED